MRARAGAGSRTTLGPQTHPPPPTITKPRFAGFGKRGHKKARLAAGWCGVASKLCDVVVVPSLQNALFITFHCERPRASLRIVFVKNGHDFKVRAEVVRI